MPTSAATSARKRDHALLSVGITFAMSGALMGANLPRLPAVRDQVGATLSELGLALVAAGVGSVLAMPWTGLLVRRVGTAGVVVGAAVLCGLAWSLVALTTSPLTLGLAMLFVGAGFGIWDVAMNVAGYDVEQRDRRSWMPRLHAAFSAGAIAGAGLAALSLRAGIPTGAHFVASAVVSVAVVVLAARRFLPTTPKEEPRPETSAPPERRLWWVQAPVLVLGLLIAGTAFGEGAANDWLALMLVDTRGATEDLAALGFAGFNAAMLAGRLVGGPAIDRWGRVAVLRAAGTTAAVGILVLALVPTLPAAVVGALLWGLGLSVVFPAVMSAAGEAVPGRGPETIAVVATIGYGGFLLGPPLLGLLGDLARLDHALLAVAVLALGIAALAGATRERRPRTEVTTGEPVPEDAPVDQHAPVDQGAPVARAEPVSQGEACPARP